jgi:urease accessory protein
MLELSLLRLHGSAMRARFLIDRTMTVTSQPLSGLSRSPKRAPGADRLERSVGKVGLKVFRRDGIDAVADLHQAGCGRILFPHQVEGAPLEAVVVNTGGGLTGGDRFDVAVTAAASARAVVTTQACEKVYRSGEGPAQVSARIVVDAGATLVWMPQETILFERSALHRSLEARVASDATFLAAEAVVLGRAAMGERLEQACFRDSWRIRRGGQLVLAEETAVKPGVWEAARSAKALLGPETAAFATLVLVAPHAPQLLEPARGLLQSHGIDGGVSVVDALLVARLVTGPGLALRQAMIPLLELLSGTRLPRVWVT